MPSKACQRPSTTSTNTNTDSTEQEEKYELGDPNNDGSVNSGDLLTLKKHLLKTKVVKDKKALTAMDVNKDDAVNSGDLLLIKKHLLGKYKIAE